MRTQARSIPPPVPVPATEKAPARRTRTDLAVPKPPATKAVMATLVTGQPESPTAVDRALVSLIAILGNDDYRPGVYGVAIFYIVAVAYFAVAGRHRRRPS